MMLNQIKVYTDAVDVGENVVLFKYASGRSRSYSYDGPRLRRLSHRLIRLLAWNEAILCRPFYDKLPGYVVFRRKERT